MGIQAILREKGGQVISIAPDATVAELVATLTDRRIGAALVVDSGRIMGVASERDVIRALAEKGAGALNLAVREVMTTPVITIRTAQTVVEAQSLMTRRRIRHLPVVDNGDLVGIVSIGDLVKERIAQAEQEALTLKDYIVSA